MTHTDPVQVQQRLAAYELDLGERQPGYEKAADERARLIRDWDKRFAICMVKAKGSNEATRKAHALVAAIEQDDLYERLKDAEARYDAHKVVVRTVETKATIGQSLLKSQGRA